MALPLALALEVVGESWSSPLGSLSSWPPHESHSFFFSFTEAGLACAQRISSTLHQGNARAILKRSPAA